MALGNLVKREGIELVPQRDFLDVWELYSTLVPSARKSELAERFATETHDKATLQRQMKPGPKSAMYVVKTLFDYVAEEIAKFDESEVVKARRIMSFPVSPIQEFRRIVGEIFPDDIGNSTRALVLSDLTGLDQRTVIQYFADRRSSGRDRSQDTNNYAARLLVSLEEELANASPIHVVRDIGDEVEVRYVNRKREIAQNSAVVVSLGDPETGMNYSHVRVKGLPQALVKWEGFNPAIKSVIEDKFGFDSSVDYEKGTIVFKDGKFTVISSDDIAARGKHSINIDPETEEPKTAIEIAQPRNNYTERGLGELSNLTGRERAQAMASLEYDPFIPHRKGEIVFWEQEFRLIVRIDENPGERHRIVSFSGSISHGTRTLEYKQTQR